MTISAKIIADSVSPQGIRLTTFQLRYGRWIHAEFLTHRVFSRNSSSSRAIPTHRLVSATVQDPPMPDHWGGNQPGMQAADECNALIRHPLTGAMLSREDAWRASIESAGAWASAFADAGYHKQIANRHVENLGWINVVCTATEWANFYALRRHEDAQPEMKALADAMWEAQQASEPALLQTDEWHLPYVLPEEIEDGGTIADPIGVLRLISTARCARVSYLTHDGRKPDISADLDLAHRLIGSQPLHASPAEHQAKPDPRWAEVLEYDWDLPHQRGNLTGWIQFRKTLPGECVEG